MSTVVLSKVETAALEAFWSLAILCENALRRASRKASLNCGFFSQRHIVLGAKSRDAAAFSMEECSK